ncbi:MAG: hypothetical protein ACR2NM_09770 [Bythopirellula sp.]
MRSIFLVIASFVVTILAWGLYGPVLHLGQAAMVTEAGHAMGEKYARLRPFVCVGLAYFAIGVVVPAILLKLKGEAGEWTVSGIVYSLAGGALGAIGALGIIMAFNFGGKPIFVMPLVFGGAPVVNSFLTIYWAKRIKEIGPVFLAGLLMVVLGAVTVLIFSPQSTKPAAAAPVVEADDAEAAVTQVKPEKHTLRDFILQLASIATVILCWGSYGPVLHKGQAAMHHSRLRPLLCVGLAYFAIAVIVPNLLLLGLPELSHYNFKGTLWSLAAGAAGAIGALGIIMAFNFGGKPVFVMPLVFGGAPVINTLFTTISGGLWGDVSAFFLAGLILVIAGAVIVLVFAPKSPPPVKHEEKLVKSEP